jgi:predicted permease
MFKNYLKTSFRNLSRNRVYSVITTAGLAVGIATCLVIFVFIRYERSFDDFHVAKDRIYRVLTKGAENDSTAAVPFPLAVALHNDIPQWQTTGIYSADNVQVQVLDKGGNMERKFKEKSGVFLLEPSFFKIFNFPWLAGDPATALSSPGTTVLTKSTAEKYFGDWRSALGRTLKIADHDVVKVTGILADPPSNSDFQLKVIFPYPAQHYAKSSDWVSISSSHGCYVLLPPGVSLAEANRQLYSFSRKYRAADNKSIQVLQSLGKVHFDASTGNFSGKVTTPERIRTLWLIAAFILVIACVNFINLSTAQAVNRAREVGVRKVLGSSRKQLVHQFMQETGLLVAMGILLAILLTSMLLGPIAGVLEVPLTMRTLGNVGVLLFLVAIMIVVTVLAGFYPALVLSGFNPIAALKSKLTARSTRGISLRRGLVVCQFVIAQGLIIGTILILRQLSYFEHASMGFNKEAVVSVSFPGDSLGLSKLDYLRNRLLAVKGIERVSFNNTSPADGDNWWTGFKFDHAAKETDFASIDKWVDANYLSAYSLPLVAGRNMTTNDSVKEFLVNEKLVHKLGITDPSAVLGKEIDLWNGWAKGAIVGVVKDFHPGSLKDSMAPVFMLNFKKGYNTAGIKISATGLPTTIAAIEKIWNDTYPSYVFEYQFLDEKIAGFYKEEEQLSRFYKIFAGLAIFLSCLGLYGLASFMAVQRIKEVGIRKVLGATVGNIVYLFSREFILLIGIAFVIAAPLAWYFVHQWLQNYAYRLPISAWIFVAGGALAVVVALATVSFQAVRAALSNPVKNLRTE